MSPALQSIRVLHVDDDPNLSDVAATLLEQEDARITVQTAPNAKDGKEMLSENDFDCIVSDYDMPGQNGIDFLQTVREEYPDLPFILYTGKGSEEVASDAISAGVTDYLQKEVGTDQYAILANRVVNAVERYRAEREAEHTRSQLQTIAANSADAIVIIDSDSQIHFANQAVDEHFGYTPSELQGNPLTRIMPERHRERHLTTITNYLTTGERTVNWSNVEFSGLHRDGTEIPLSISFGEYEQDEEQRFIGIMRDMTERKEQTRQLETLISNLPGMVYRCRNKPEWPMEIVRGECETLTGYSAEALERGDIVWSEDVLHPAEKDRLWETVQRALDNDSPFEVTYRIQTKDGATRWVWERGRVVTPRHKQESRLEGFITDITKRKEHEQELEQANALHSTLIEALPVGVLAEDASRNILSVNERLFELFDMPGTPEEVIGADCERIAEQVSEMFVEPERFVDRINELIAEEKSATDDELGLTDGRTFERSYQPIDLPDGDGHLWLYRDITERTERE